MSDTGTSTEPEIQSAKVRPVRLKGTEDIVLTQEVTMELLKQLPKLKEDIRSKYGLGSMQEYTPEIGQALADEIFRHESREYTEEAHQDDFKKLIIALSKQPEAFSAYINSRDDRECNLFQRLYLGSYEGDTTEKILDTIERFHVLPDQGLEFLTSKIPDTPEAIRHYRNGIEYLVSKTPETSKAVKYYMSGREYSASKLPGTSGTKKDPKSGINNLDLVVQHMVDTDTSGGWLIQYLDAAIDESDEPEKYMSTLIQNGFNDLKPKDDYGEYKKVSTALKLKCSAFEIKDVDDEALGEFLENNHEISDMFEHQKNHLVGALWFTDKRLQEAGSKIKEDDSLYILEKLNKDLFLALYKDMKMSDVKKLAKEFHDKLENLNAKINTIFPEGDWQPAVENTHIPVPENIADGHYFKNVTSNRELHLISNWNNLKICIADKAASFISGRHHVFVLFEEKGDKPVATMRFSIHSKDYKSPRANADIVNTPDCALHFHDITNYDNIRDFSSKQNKSIEWIKDELRKGNIKITDEALHATPKPEDTKYNMASSFGFDSIRQHDSIGGVDIWQRAFDYYGKPRGSYDMRDIESYRPGKNDPAETTPLSKMEITKTPRIEGIPAIKIKLSDGSDRYMIPNEYRGKNVREFIIDHDLDKKFIKIVKKVLPSMKSQLDAINLRGILKNQLGKGREIK